VVARRAPVSAHIGDRAIIFADGRMDGFVGGACSREIVRRQAREAIEARCGRLVSIRPDVHAAADSSDEHVFVPMTCVSEGAIDVYIEPALQARAIVVAGMTPVADAVARLARAMDYDVVRVVESAELQDIQASALAAGMVVVAVDALSATLDGSDRYVAAVVATQGHYDEEALTSALRAGMPYVGLVASRKRGAAVRQQLEESGIANVAAIKSPAGLDLGARTPPEVALSILAEIVQAQPSGRSRTAAPAVVAAHAVDPVCGMQVEIATAKHSADVDGVSYYFCCPHCRARFVKQPQDFLASPVHSPHGAGPDVQSPA
jgi:xanthine dehydrogenase accessory factor